MKHYIKKMLLLLAALIAVLALNGCGSKNKIDLQEIIHLEPYGADGYGAVRDWMDEEALLAMLQNGKTDEDSILDGMKTMGLLYQIDYRLDKEEHLSNGDKITVTVTYPDSLAEALDADITPKSGESWTVVVSGLAELHEYDVFGDVDVSFEGYNGYGKAVIVVNGGSRLQCSASQLEGLSNGDVITVTLKAPNGGDLIDYCISEEFLPAAECKEYTVTNLKEAPRVDLFEGIDIAVMGRSPFLSLSIRGKYENDGIGYELDEGFCDGALTAGETVTIRAFGDSFWERVDLDEQCMENLDALPAAKTYTYTIPADQEHYLMTQDQLTDEVLAQAIAEAKDHFDAADKAEDLAFHTVTYDKFYLQSIKHADGCNDSCRLYIVHEVHYTRNGEACVAYNVVKFAEPYMDIDGRFRAERAENLYAWAYGGIGVADLYDFEEEIITPDKADYETVTGT